MARAIDVIRMTYALNILSRQSIKMCLAKLHITPNRRSARGKQIEGL